MGARAPRGDGSPIRPDAPRDGDTLLLVVYRDDIDNRTQQAANATQDAARRASLSGAVDEATGERLTQAQIDEAADDLAIAESEVARRKTECQSLEARDVAPARERRRSSVVARETEEQAERKSRASALRSRLSATGGGVRARKSLRSRISNAGAEDQLKGIAALALAHEEHRGDTIDEEDSGDSSTGDESSGDDLEDSLEDASRDLDDSAEASAGKAPEEPPDADDAGIDVNDEELERDWNKWRRVAYVVELENYDKIVAKANRGTNCRKTKKRGKDSQKKRRGSKETAGSGDTALDEQIAERRRHESISDACGEDGPDEPDKAADSPAKGGEVRQAEAAS